MDKVEKTQRLLILGHERRSFRINSMVHKLYTCEREREREAGVRRAGDGRNGQGEQYTYNWVLFAL